MSENEYPAHADFMHERPYQRLIVWQEAHRLCLEIYNLVPCFPGHERYCLAQQMRKSAYSVPTNIAEGNTRRTAKDKLNFVTIALASLEELHYQLLLARDLSYITKEKFLELEVQIQKTGYLLTRFRLGIAKSF